MKTIAKASQAGLVLIAGPNAKLRSQWREGLPGKYTVREVTERGDLDRNLIDLQPAVLLLDRTLCNSERLEDVSALQSLSPSTKIVLLAEKPEPAEGVFALKVGAKGYCTQEILPQLLKKAVEMVQEGQIWVERSVMPYLLGELASYSEHKTPDPSTQLSQQDNVLDSLTPRERAVADLIADGGWNKEIACRLNITEATVKAHLTAIFRKIGVTDRLQLGLFLARHTNATPVNAPVDQQVPMEPTIVVR